MVKVAVKSLTLPFWTSKLQFPDRTYGGSSSCAVAVSLPVVVLVIVVALLESDILPVVVIVVSLVADDVSVSLAVVIVVVAGAISPVSKIRVDIEPLAENVDPSVALVVVALPVLVWFVVVVVGLVALVEVVAFDVVFCAIAGARLNAAAKSPKTRTSSTAIDALFIPQNVQE
jgi:hypothetical protein